MQISKSTLYSSKLNAAQVAWSDDAKEFGVDQDTL